jgi:hypothetical protein
MYKFLFWCVILFFLRFSNFRKIIPKNKNNEILLTDDPSNVLLFSQITDIHLSHLSNKPKDNFDLVINTLKNIIKPEFLLNTGDLTDAIYLFHLYPW